MCGTALTLVSVIYCMRCTTPHHDDCFAYNGRCAVYGCASAEAGGAPLLPDATPVVILEEPGETRRMFIPAAPEGGLLTAVLSYLPLPRRMRMMWEVDADTHELARVVRGPLGVNREIVESLELVRAVLVARTELISTTRTDGSGWYRSAWRLSLRWHGRVRDLSPVEWTDGHSEPPRELLSAGRRLARLLGRPLELDPPSEGSMPPGLGKLPSQH